MAFPAIAQQGRRLRLMKHASGQTFREGAALVLSSGEVIVAATAAAAVNTIGFATEDANPTLVDSRTVDVTPNDESIVSIGHASATFLMEIWAAGARVEPAQSDVGVTYGVAADASNGAWYVNRSDTVNGAVVVVDIVPKDAIPPQKGSGNAAITSLVEVKLLNPYG